ncbi:MAG: hypothetical protein Q9188_004095 [Gyalolechia gomerana]
MPPKSSLTSSFSASELDKEVICPLKTLDGSNCRKRCLGVSAFAQSIALVSPCCIHRAQANREFKPRRSAIARCRSTSEEHTQIYGHDRDVQVHDYGSSLAAPRSFSEAYPAAATAAVALAQLHNHRPDSEYGSEAGYISENDLRPHTQSSSVELPPIQNHAPSGNIPPFQSPRPRELLPSIMARSPPGRSSTLPPLHRKDKPRPRRSSITQNSRKPKHERNKSSGHARRLSIEGRKALSAEPYGPAAVAQGKRWEDLLEAATSANEADSDRDLTPNAYRDFARTVSMSCQANSIGADRVRGVMSWGRGTRLFN